MTGGVTASRSRRISWSPRSAYFFRLLLSATAALLDESHASYAGQVTFFEVFRPVDDGLRICLRQFSLNLRAISWMEWEGNLLRTGEMLVRRQTEANRVRPSTRIEMYRIYC